MDRLFAAGMVTRKVSTATIPQGSTQDSQPFAVQRGDTALTRPTALSRELIVRHVIIYSDGPRMVYTVECDIQRNL